MDDGLKQRLIGAIVLIAIAVLFVPSLFEKSSQRTVDLSTQIPEKPDLVTEILELPEPVRPANVPPAPTIERVVDSEPSPLRSSEAGSSNTSENERENENEEQLAQESPSKPIAEGNTVPADSILDSDGVPISWSIQVASFKSKDRALALIDKLQADGHRSYQREFTSAQGLVYRVYVGPKIDKQLILDAKAKIDKKYNTSAIVLEFKS